MSKTKNAAPDIDPQLEEVISEIEKKNLQSDAARYDIGALINEVRRNARYGDRAVRRIAERTLLDEKTLRAHARVAEVFPRDRFEQLRSRPRPPSWSHLVLLSTVEDELREEIIASCVNAPMSEKQLRKFVKEKRRARDREAEIEPPPTTIEQQSQLGTPSGKQSWAELTEVVRMTTALLSEDGPPPTPVDVERLYVEVQLLMATVEALRRQQVRPDVGNIPSPISRATAS